MNYDRLSNVSADVTHNWREHFISSLRVYDFQSIVTASSLIFGFVFGAPLAIWFGLKQINLNLKIVTIGCLYGYSLFVFIPATVRYYIIKRTTHTIIFNLCLFMTYYLLD